MNRRKATKRKEHYSVLCAMMVLTLLVGIMTGCSENNRVVNSNADSAIESSVQDGATLEEQEIYNNSSIEPETVNTETEDTSGDEETDESEHDADYYDADYYNGKKFDNEPLVISRRVEQIGDYKVVEYEDGSLKILRYLGNDQKVEIPAYIHGKQVTGIATNTFCEASDIREISIPDTIKYIHYSAFQGTEWLEMQKESGEEWLSINNGVQNIYIGTSETVTVPKDFKTFDLSKSEVCEVRLEDGITCIPNGCFSCCQNLSYISIPSTVIEIGEYAFDLCTSLTEILLPDNLETIGAGAFYFAGIEKIEIPSSVAMIARATFEFSSIEQVTLHEGLTTIGDSAFAWTSLDNIEFPSTLKHIEDGAFENSNLTQVILPDGLETIGDEAFYDILWLEKAVIPDSVMSIGKDVFTCASDDPINDYHHVELVCSEGSYAWEYAIQNEYSHSEP